MKHSGKYFSIKRTIVFTFMLIMFGSIGSIGIIIFTSWFSSAEKTTESIAEDLNKSIYNQIYSFIHVPSQINDTNYKIVANGILDISDEELRDMFFVGVLDSYDDDIYSFSFGNIDGEYFGARRSADGVIEIMKNNAHTGGNSWYYSVNEDMKADDLVVQAGEFDPRTRAWYKAAVEKGGPTFSPIYKHFVMDDLTISFASPIFTKTGELQGVLGTHMLLNDLGTYLKDAVSKYDGYAVILEKGSNALIANSMGVDNFTVLPDGTLERYGIDKIEYIDKAYSDYLLHHNSNYFYEDYGHNLYMNVKEINMEGIDWVVISAIPEELLITPAVKSIQLTVLLTILALLMSLLVYMIVIRKLLKPINILLYASETLSNGDFTKRVNMVRNDEIGKISESFNKMADKMQFFINNLEVSVQERTKELHMANASLEESKNKLQLILDSTAEAIYGVDIFGRCTFCNMSCIKLLGYNNQVDLLGKNMHFLIHHSRHNGTQLPVEDCRIHQSIQQGEGFEGDDEVFWRADGTSFHVEYHSYPQIKNGEVIGGVVTFMDITDRKLKEEQIQYLSSHDALTGLYNRRCFEAYCTKIDIPENLPLSIIFADINGLKMTNDIFGHTTGDELIKKSAEILVQSCSETDIVARVGGDEFIILLPKTNEKSAEELINRIKFKFSETRIAAIKCSISLGYDTKNNFDQSLGAIMSDAENAMYKDKTMNRKSVNKDIINTLVETLHSKNAKEKQHAVATSELCGEVGLALNFSVTDINKLKRAAYLHDIGKIVLDESFFTKEIFIEEELEKTQQHPVIGYRILNLFDETLDLAEYVYSHHERWDGSGYPRGVSGEQIPLIARIISIVETYHRVLNKGNISSEERKMMAIETIKEGAGKQFDPEIVKVFIQMMKERK